MILLFHILQITIIKPSLLCSLKLTFYYTTTALVSALHALPFLERVSTDKASDDDDSKVLCCGLWNKSICACCNKRLMIVVKIENTEMNGNLVKNTLQCFDGLQLPVQNMIIMFTGHVEPFARACI